ncbi:MAG TPA: 50S ribosomal protein L9 [Lachnospiraceae bacterium]|nr:50S ribosomal protein L9 [Lachnospiraceae bacterium]
MKVILLEDVKKVGKKGEIVEVSDAYARNVLIRKNQGVEATSANLNTLKLKKANDEKVAAENLAEAEALKKEIEEKAVLLKVKTGEGGKLFGSISNGQIADAMKEQLGIGIDRRKIVIDAPIKNTGEMTVDVKLHPQVKAELKVKVEAL